ncbi:MAG TPA: cellulase family glycosylhydrolase, partial [Herpetosiphonaceae bacterium]|nr:cellulase family glycosylhydrolase [Herpetosiphonaceae bacterium]
MAAVLAALLVAFGLVGGAGSVNTASAARNGFAMGVIVDTTDARSMRMAREGGFTHAKMVLHWAAVEPSPGNLMFKQTKENDLDNIMKPARNEGMVMIVRVDGVPGWAGGSPANANLDAVRSFYEEIARYGAGTVVGYEILNEPNL